MARRKWKAWADRSGHGPLYLHTQPHRGGRRPRDCRSPSRGGCGDDDDQRHRRQQRRPADRRRHARALRRRPAGRWRAHRVAGADHAAGRRCHGSPRYSLYAARRRRHPDDLPGRRRREHGGGERRERQPGQPARLRARPGDRRRRGPVCDRRLRQPGRRDRKRGHEQHPDDDPELPPGHGRRQRVRHDQQSRPGGRRSVHGLHHLGAGHAPGRRLPPGRGRQ